ncbi:uncharacterized protein LOC133907132 isoform X2 [Phragmites australis]|uniref:uncharacterized protein LOC133907132 isoform X2 n=1 Tax=Phragmites australis TaxID=29695 RepID=UPI002D766DBF|nr:uncharacterized protein LOC133907132 isoform X2 [Phragmites australis]
MPSLVAGVYVMISGLDLERLVLTAGPVGLMQASLDVVRPYIRQREQFGRPVGEFQFIQICTPRCSRQDHLYTRLLWIAIMAKLTARIVQEQFSTLLKGQPKLHFRSSSMPERHQRAVEQLPPVRPERQGKGTTVTGLLRRREGTCRRGCALRLRLPGLPRRQGENKPGEGVLSHQQVRCHHHRELWRVKAGLRQNWLNGEVG